MKTAIRQIQVPLTKGLRFDEAHFIGMFGELELRFCMKAMAELWPKLSKKNKAVLTISASEQPGFIPVELNHQEGGWCWRWSIPTRGMADQGSDIHYFGFSERTVDVVVARLARKSVEHTPRSRTIWVNLEIRN